jgi:hypothetical protein
MIKPGDKYMVRVVIDEIVEKYLFQFDSIPSQEEVNSVVYNF